MSAYQATIAFDDTVWRHGYDSEEAVLARNAAETARCKSIGLADTHEAQPTGAAKSQLYRENLFGKVPRALARDARLSAVETVIIVHRAIFTGDFVPKEGVVKKIVRGGIGKDRIRNAIARLRDEEAAQARCRRQRAGDPIEPELLGYIRRYQRVDRNGEFTKAREVLCLPECCRPCLVPRKWFDGRFSESELAALIYIQAGTDKGGRPYVREIMERYRWKRQKTAKVVGALAKKGCLKELPDQRHGGRFAGVRFDLANRKTVDLRRVRKSGNGATGNGKPGNIHRSSLNTLATQDTKNILLRDSSRSYASRQRAAYPPDFSHDDQGSFLVSGTKFLSWAEGEPYEDELFNTSPELVDEICDLAEDGQLRSLLREAAGGRIRSNVLSEEGLDTFRLLTAYIVEHPPLGETFAPSDALKYVLAAIRHRIGDRPDAWLNSIGVIGKRLLAPTIGGDGVDEDPYRSRRRRRKKPQPKLTDELKTLIKADGARVLASKLRRDPKGLNSLLRKYGPEALEAIKGCLLREMIDGGEIHKIKTWHYFVDVLEEDQFKAQGIRPGDLPGWRQTNQVHGQKGDNID